MATNALLNFASFKNHRLIFLLKKSNCLSSRNFAITSSMLNVQHLKYSVKDNVGLVVFDSPGKVNSLNKEVLDQFSKIFDEIDADPRVNSAVLISAKPDCFIAGADIGMLKACKSAEEVRYLSTEGQRILMKIEESQKPYVAAVMGSCLGGGLEVALAAHYRIGVKSAKTIFGAPEVQLGLLPGAGGTQRLPKLISLENALDLMLTGKSLNSQKAKQIGLIDQVVDILGPGLATPEQLTLEFLEEVAIATAKKMASKSLKPTIRKVNMKENIMMWILKYNFGRKWFYDQVKAKVMKTTKGVFPAPFKIIDTVRLGLEEGNKAGYKAESEAFGELGATDVSKALIGLFDGMTSCKKNHYGVPIKPVKKLAVLGAGLMGAGIAQVSIDKGIPTILKDVSAESLVKGQQQIEKGLKTSVLRKKITQSVADRILSNLEPTISYAGLKDVDMVIEAVFEDIKVKHAVLKEVELHTPEHCVFATNTSALSIAKVAEGSKRPEKVVGMHYFSPVDKMMLLEIVRSEKTSKDTIASVVDMGLKQGKVVITVKDSPGFYTTRCLIALISEAFELILEGMSASELDKRTTSMGFPVGSATLIDEVGIDVGAHISEYMADALGDKLFLKKENSRFYNEMVTHGFLGRKAGKGIFVYQTNSKDRQINEGFLQIIKPYQKAPLIPLNDEDIRLRILSRFANQCIMCLEEGILANALEGDIGAVFGLGFPAYLGGPFKFVDIYGADKLVSKMKSLQQVYGDRFAPCQLLLDHAKDNKLFHPQPSSKL